MTLLGDTKEKILIIEWIYWSRSLSENNDKKNKFYELVDGTKAGCKPSVHLTDILFLSA